MSSITDSKGYFSFVETLSKKIEALEEAILKQGVPPDLTERLRTRRAQLLDVLALAKGEAQDLPS